MSTYMANAQTVERKWYVIDANGKTLGRLATQIATILRGKHKPTYTPHVDTGDFVIVINSDLVEVTGKKAEQKLYRRHTDYPGGLKEITFEEQMKKDSRKVIYTAVKGMLPKNALGKNMIKKLKIYAGPDHNHEAQQPELLEI